MRRGSVWVDLTDLELEAVDLIAGARSTNAADHHRRETLPTPAAIRSTSHYTGALGEVAVASFLGVFDAYLVGDPISFHRRNLGDVLGIEVRSTSSASGRLPIRRRDNLERAFAFARTHRAPAIELVGFTFGRVAARERSWVDADELGPGYWRVPDEELLSPIFAKRALLEAIRDTLLEARS